MPTDFLTNAPTVVEYTRLMRPNAACDDLPCIIMMVTSIPTIFLAVLPLVALIAFVVVVRLAIRRFWRRRKRPVPVERCKCGYSIENLLIARCPECGRVFGFDATAEELGLSDEQLQRAQAARIQRNEPRNPANRD